ncbi:MAG: tetratricopeptide repeat protein [Thermodesulfobacteriota bacterium]|nr:tetratricopeptide repeat protein [Thermodesulfobacteriota bacterium]
MKKSRNIRKNPAKRHKTNFILPRYLLPILFISLLTIIIYSNTLHSPFVFDDIPNITENPPIRLTDINLASLKNAALGRTSKRPIPNLSFAINFYMERYNVRGYHIVNIVIHTINGILVYLLALAVFTQLKGNPKETSLQINLMSLFASLIFVAHPINTQSVTYIVQRMNSMAVMFYLLSFFLYIRARLSNIKWRKWALFSGVIISGILALGSKQIAATLPFIIILYEWYFFQDMKASWLKKNIPYLMIPIIVLAVLALIYMGENPINRILAGYGSRDFTLIERVLTQFRIIIFYISLLILPLPSRLNLIHHISTSQSLINPITTLISLLIIVVLITLSVYWARKKRLISFAILWFFINLAIESSFIGLEMIFEHRLYLPMVGFSLMVSYIIFNYLVNRRRLTIGVCVVIIMLLGYGAYVRNRTWRDGITLWSDVVAKNPLSYRGYNNLGRALVRHGRLQEAISQYAISLRVKPDYIKAHNNLGNAFMRQGFTEKAIDEYLEALKIKPDYEKAHNNLGLALASQGRLKEAIDEYSEAIRIRYNYADAHNNFGIALARQGRLNEAMKQLYEALRIKPGYGDAHYNLGITLSRMDRFKEAEDNFFEVLKINPNDAEAHYYMGNALKKQGKLNKTISHYYKALKLKPDFVKVHINLGVALSSLGRFKEAIAHYFDAIRINPHFKAASYYNIACLYSRQNMIQESVKWLEEAVNAGFKDWDIIKTDEDLINIRGSLLYKQLLEGRLK